MVGTAVLVALPEIARPLAEYRMLVYGALLMAVIAYLPRGIVDTLLDYLRKPQWRARAASTDRGPSLEGPVARAAYPSASAA